MTTMSMKQGDTLPELIVQLLGSAGTPLDLTTATSVTFKMRTSAGVILVQRAAVVETAAEGRVRFIWQVGDTDVIGNHDVEWTIVFPGAKEVTIPNKGYDTIHISARLG